MENTARPPVVHPTFRAERGIVGPLRNFFSPDTATSKHTHTHTQERKPANTPVHRVSDTYPSLLWLCSLCVLTSRNAKPAWTAASIRGYELLKDDGRRREFSGLVYCYPSYTYKLKDRQSSQPTGGARRVTLNIAKHVSVLDLSSLCDTEPLDSHVHIVPESIIRHHFGSCCFFVERSDWLRE